MKKFDSDAEVVQTREDWSSPIPTVAILDAVSDVENVSPLELDFVLYNHIDPEALDSLVSTRQGDGVEIQFSIGGRSVRIDAETITISHENGQ